MKHKMMRIKAVMIRHYFSWRRDLESIFESLLWPTIDLALWGLLSVYIGTRDVNTGNLLTGFVAGAVFLWMFVYRSQQDISMLLLREIWDRNFTSVFTSPISMDEYLIAVILLSMMKLIFSALWLFVLALLMFGFSVFSLGIWLVPFVLNLMFVGIWTGFIINGLVIRYGYRIQSIAWSLIVIIQPFSAVFYPVSVLPRWMQTVGKILPTSYIFEGMREVLSAGTMDISAVWISSGLNVLYLIAAVWFFRHMWVKAKDEGMLVKFN